MYMYSCTAVASKPAGRAALRVAGQAGWGLAAAALLAAVAGETFFPVH